MSPRRADRWGARLGGLVHRLWRRRRRIAFDNLTAALGDEYSESELCNLTRRAFENIGRTFVEIARFGVLKPEGIADLIEDQRVEMFQEIYDRGRGAVLLSAHFGNWELLGSWIASKGFPCTFVVGRHHNVQFDHLVVRLRRQMGVGVLYADSEVREVFRRLHRGEFICMVSDQHAPSASVVLNFFGRPAATPKGPALFAIRNRCPVVATLLRRERYDRHVIMVDEPIYPPDTGDQEADIQSITERYTRFFEEGIRKYPDQWLWTHRRWKLENPATDAVGKA
jgi:KDO2-lipid IV(A) lauroyltransferase